MAVLALKTSAYRNAVSRLHRDVSQEMFHDLWPQLPVWEVPITSVTNGVHCPSWLNGDLAGLYDQYLQPDWRERFNDVLDLGAGEGHPDEELLEVHRRRKRRLVNFVRARQSSSALRRQASAAEVRHYRAKCWIPTLSPSVLRAASPPTSAPRCCSATWSGSSGSCSNKDMPVQIVIAGKAHPKDQPGKSFIREIVQLSRDPDCGSTWSSWKTTT
jgi:glycogen phosphorylase